MPDEEKPRGRLFISYSRANKAQVYPFAETLTDAGIQIWIDREEIAPLDDFPARIRDGLAQCQALLAWYSPEYPRSTYCQKELIAAWMCAQGLTRDILSRVFVVNPGGDVSHICLGDVGRENYLAVPEDRASRSACVELIRKKLSVLSDDFSGVRNFRRPQWFPNQQQSSARFVGRLEELWAIHTGLNPIGISEHESANAVMQLRGLGGVGKTLLAIEYAERFGAVYPGGIHWLRAYGFDPNRPMDTGTRERERRTQLEDLALRYDVPIRDRDFREISRDLGRELALGSPYLWVVDDLPGGLDQERGFREWCAPTSNGSTLMTTRSKDYEGIGSSIVVDTLAPQPALQLLTQERKPRSECEREEAEALAEDLGRHALALDVAGHFLLKTRDFATLHEELTRGLDAGGGDPLGELAAGLSGQLPGGHEKSIVATLAASLRVLGEHGLNLLRLACELHGGTTIPKRLAREVLTRAFALEEGAAEDYYALAVNQSEMHSLANVSLGGPEGDAFSVHSLVRYTLLHADPAQGEAPVLRQRLHEMAVSALADLLQDVVDIGKHARLALEVSHAKHLVLQPRTADEGRLLLVLARFEDVRGNYREALAIGRRVLPIQERVLGRDHPDTLRTRNNNVCWTVEIGEAGEGLRLAQELLPDQLRVLGPDHPNTLTNRNNIAASTGETGNAGEALRLFRELLPDQTRVLGPNHPETLRTRNNIAHWTGTAGQPGDALRLFRELLPDQMRVLGPNLLETLRTRNNIALWTGETGNAGEALHLFRELLPDQTRVLGPNHPETLRTRNNIGLWTGQLGKADEALRLFRELLPDLERVLGPDHPDTLLARNNIGWCTTEPCEALRLFRELLPDQTRVLGPDHPDTLGTRSNIAHWTRLTGDVEGAIRLYRELLPDAERVLGPNHPHSLVARVNIARLEQGQTPLTAIVQRLRNALARRHG